MIENKLITAAEAEEISESWIDNAFSDFIKYFNDNIKRAAQEGSRQLLVTTSPQLQHIVDEELISSGFGVTIQTSTTMLVEW